MQFSDDRFQAGQDGTSENCMKLTSAECTVENSLRWTEKMPETSRVL
jgi:hypothetical protein